MTLTPEMQALREAAERATPGKWIAQHEYDGDRLTDVDTGNEFSSVLPENGSWPEDVICEVWSGNHLDEPNAKFIAAANPTVILALLASYEALTAENNHAIDSIAQLQEEVLALQARLSTVRKLPNLSNPELMQLGTRTCSVEGEHFLPTKFGRAVINALHDQIEVASVAAQTGTDAPLFALVNRLSLIDPDADFDARELLREYAKEAAGIVGMPRSTGYSCPTCCAKPGEQHAPGCNNTD